jgi:hypothetical protein
VALISSVSPPSIQSVVPAAINRLNSEAARKMR